ncbi:MAG: SDR family oxidoreductase [Bacteroidetes bacterium]|nr:SDR family oxidoreductase [Bacteroidota bacterium]MBU1579733.1 SDR family oxidoreductase [Bacteroidota bacterium]MBU2556395.1 SDR family oxidoreductase [Bacteroidota bacterium]
MDVLIAGSGRGIGLEICRLFLIKADVRLMALSRNISRLTEIQKQQDNKHEPGELIPVAIDFEVAGFTDRLKETLDLHVFKPKIVIYNAGLLINKKISEFSENDFDRLFHVNTKAAFLLMQMVLPYLTKQAHMITISSMGGYQGSAKFPGLALYSASKAALAVMSECFAEELRDNEVSVNSLALGAAQTEMLAEAFPGYEAPLSAAQMAEFIVDFACNGNKYFNGKILPVSLSTP